MSFAPNLDYLREVDRSGILVSVTNRVAKGPSWSATGGLYKLRLHEEAGLVRSMLTHRWADIEQGKVYRRPAELTDEGRRVLAALDAASKSERSEATVPARS